MTLSIEEIRHINDLQMARLINPPSLNGQMQVDMQKMRMELSESRVPRIQTSSVSAMGFKTTPISGLNCDHCGDPNCTCNKGVSGLNCGCTQNLSDCLPQPLAGLGGLSVDFTGALAGGIICAAGAFLLGFGQYWQLAGAAGIVAGGLVLPSMYN